MTLQKPELLAPAGNFEKLKIAIRYGADAVYLGAKTFSLRNFSGNFTMDELRAAVLFAHEQNVKVYAACNIYSRNHEQDAISAYLKQLGEIRPDAVIIADPGIIAEARAIIPEIPIHLSTQANTTNYKTAQFWETLGIRRINLARELSLKEIKHIADKTSLEIEAFVHGAMCISYSGRCLLSNFMANRASNQGMCCHPCRFNYAVVEEKRPGQYFPLMEDERGTYIFNSKDLCMLEHIPEMITSRVDSLKIEGRMKGIQYLALTVKVYREAIDAYAENPENYAVKDYWRTELSKINYRGYCTGFYMADAKQIMPNYAEGRYHSGSHFFVGKIISVENSNLSEFSRVSVTVQVRNKIFNKDSLEILSPKGPPKQSRILEIINDQGETVPFAQPNSLVTIIMDTNDIPLSSDAPLCSPDDLISSRREQNIPTNI